MEHLHQTPRIAIGKGRASNIWSAENIEVFTPIPSARVSMATTVKPGSFSSWRKANFRSFIKGKREKGE
jgi:hypothetical protein